MIVIFINEIINLKSEAKQLENLKRFRLVNQYFDDELL